MTLRICISEPLSGASCAPVPEQPQNTERFRHYSSPVGSYDSLCQVLDTFTLPDEFGLAPNGWSAWLRPDALKVFVVVTDDSAGCASATSGALFSMADDPDMLAAHFDTELRRLSSSQFQDPSGMRDYKWYSIVGLSHSAVPTDPPVETPCETAPTPGLAYQALSRLTDSMRYPVCEGTSFPQAFMDIAGEVVEEALPCQGR
jgi:hypothetical protein